MENGGDGTMQDKPVVLFDGTCNLCNRSVRFIIERDPQDIFRFSSFQSRSGKRLLEKCGVKPRNVNSIVLSEAHRCLTESDAVIEIASRLHGLWPALVARNRFRWSERPESCFLPAGKNRDRFLS
jgi:predicted DCC family thiol-disulfide oxidoreductase YuxK